MTQPGLPASAPDQQWRIALLAALRIVLSLGALLAAYYLIPVREEGAGADLPWLALALCTFSIVVGVQLRGIARSKHPIARAVEMLALAVPLFLLIFARSYLFGSMSDPGSFNEVLDRTGALYFSVTCFVTVGFGDIVATSNPMRLLVTLQMLLDLVVLGVLVRLFIMAARRGMADRTQEPREPRPPR